MAREVPGRCPICGGEVLVTSITCCDCASRIEGGFGLCRFCRLTAEQKSFIEVFIKCRGNIKEVEKELGISYPTVRGRLEDTAAALGYGQGPETEDQPRRGEILEKLSKGEITADEAVSMLKEVS